MQSCRTLLVALTLFAIVTSVGCGGAEVKQDPVKVQEETKVLSDMSKGERSGK